MTSARHVVALVAACAAALAACATPTAAPRAPAPPAAAPAPAAPAAATPAVEATLYARLGGQPAIEAVVGDFLGNVAADARIQHRFALSDLGDLKQKLVDQICAAAGGPCTYKGGDMKTVHKGMGITSADFDALVEDLVKSLDAHHVPAREKSELLGALAPMKKDIVEQP